MGLLAFLWSCVRGDATPDAPFAQREGIWYYGDARVDGVDAGTFRTLSSHYAIDARQVYYGESYRKGQEYYAVKRFRVWVVDSADPSSFLLMRDPYARDNAHIFFKGNRLAVRDPASFELTDWGLYTRDRLVAYFDDVEIAGSDGASFRPLSNHYAVDRARVYFDNRVISNDPATFEVLENGAARTASEYFQDGNAVKPPPP